MNEGFLILIAIFFAITPNLGFFQWSSFLILCLVSFFVFFSFFFSKKRVKKLSNLSLVTIILIAYGLLYYPGIYQNVSSNKIGFFIYFLFIFTLIIQQHQTLFSSLINKYYLLLLIFFYLILGLWTIYNSPSPRVDVFVVSKEAPSKLLKGQNPYQASYSPVYQEVKPDYYPYLPISFIITLPFTLIFNDPRLAIIFFNLISVFLLNKLIIKKGNPQDRNAFISLFLFFPRSFYLLEHMYLDQIILSFLIMFLFWFKEKKEKLAFFFLSLFFSFKIYLLTFIPVFLYQLTGKLLKNIIFFLTPFIFILFFLFINPKAFLSDTIFFYNPKTVSAPLHLSLSLPNYLKKAGLSQSFSTLFCLLIFVSLYLFIIKSREKILDKLAVSLFLFNILTPETFFNHYFLTVWIFFLSIGDKYFKLKLIE